LIKIINRCTAAATVAQSSVCSHCHTVHVWDEVTVIQPLQPQLKLLSTRCSPNSMSRNTYLYIPQQFELPGIASCSFPGIWEWKRSSIPRRPGNGTLEMDSYIREIPINWLSLLTFNCISYYYTPNYSYSTCICRMSTKNCGSWIAHQITKI